MDNQRNTILAIALSMLVLLGWNIFYLEPQFEAQRRAAEEAARLNPPIESSVPMRTDDLAGALDGTVPVDPGQTTVEGAVPGIVVPGLETAGRETVLAASPRVPIETAAVSGSINLKGARLDDLILRRYRQDVDLDSPPVELLSPASMPDGYFIDVGYYGPAGSTGLPDADVVWAAEPGAKLTETTPVTLTHDSGDGLVIERTISIDDDYLFIVQDRIVNARAEPVALTSYGRSTRFQKPASPPIFVLHEGFVGFFGNEGLQEVGYGEGEDAYEDRLSDRRKPGFVLYDQPETEGWLGMTDKYWATALIPSTATDPNVFTPAFRYVGNGRAHYQADFVREAAAVPAGGTATVTTHLYAGAKKSSIIDQIGAEYGIAKFELMIDWGWFKFITRPMFALISWLYSLVGNFGVAILLATVVVKAIFFPLANKSYASMAKMKMIQPKMTEIREKHAEDRQAQQRAMMELYKTEKINPVAGCWPVLLQIPVFFALYKVIYVTIEMRHAPFFGWINDLSAPDPTSIWELFGLFPWGASAILPAFLLLGVWPIIMGVTMFLQMRMNPTPPDPTQQMIFTWMPVLFTFMLSTFPAGLVIYWAWNNTLSIIQQGVIMKKNGAKIELWDNLKGLFTRKKAADPAE